MFELSLKNVSGSIHEFMSQAADMFELILKNVSGLIHESGSTIVVYYNNNVLS